MATSSDLGPVKTAHLAQGAIDYHERGEGQPVVLLHGVLVNADLWRAVVPQVAQAGFRCLTPDLPLGAHRSPMPAGADLTPPALADLISDFLDELDLTDVTLVANDTAAALTQILMTRRHERVGRVVLTNGDAWERFFPPQFNYLTKAVRLPGLVWLLSRVLGARPLQRLPITFGWLTKRPLPRRWMDSYVGPARRDAGIRRDLRAVVSAIHRRHTLEAARRLPEFDKPVLLVWAPEDRLFPLSLGQRIAGQLPDARLVEVADSYTYIPENQPDRLAELIGEFAASPAPATQ